MIPPGYRQQIPAPSLLLGEDKTGGPLRGELGRKEKMSLKMCYLCFAFLMCLALQRGWFLALFVQHAEGLWWCCKCLVCLKLVSTHAGTAVCSAPAWLSLSRGFVATGSVCDSST